MILGQNISQGEFSGQAQASQKPSFYMYHTRTSFPFPEEVAGYIST